jgi:hypothetical protein
MSYEKEEKRRKREYFGLILFLTDQSKVRVVFQKEEEQDNR